MTFLKKNQHDILRDMGESRYILGLCMGHDATAVLMKNGKIVEAMQEERLSRMKKHVGFPHLAIAHVLAKHGLEREGIKHVYIASTQGLGAAFITLNDNIARRSEEVHIQSFWSEMATKWSLFAFMKQCVWWYRQAAYWLMRADTRAKSFIQAQFPNAEVNYIDHHLMHAWATVPFIPKDGKRRLVFTLDGEGDGLSGTINIFDGSTIEVKHSFREKHSIGLLYSSVTDMLGMRRNEHEFKVMGLAPYAKQSAGEKAYEALRELVWFDKEKMEVVSSVDTRVATPYMLARQFTCRFRFDSLAYGVQKLVEEIVCEIAVTSMEKYGIHDLVIGGGVFMNVKANQRLQELSAVRSLTVAPSCGDESLAIGAAAYGYSVLKAGDLSELEVLKDLYLGSECSDDTVKQAIDSYPYVEKCDVEYFEPNGADTIEKAVARVLAGNDVVGRFKGRAEWGARALGNRSILANPSSRDNVRLINEMIKNRDFWMPFATSILFEESDEYLVNPKNVYAPFMAITFETKERAHRELPAALHPYDQTSRPQMVKREVNPEYHALISHFSELTGISGVLNTSFNLHGEPNVETPTDALRTFEHSGLRYLALGNYLLKKR